MRDTEDHFFRVLKRIAEGGLSVDSTEGMLARIHALGTKRAIGRVGYMQWRADEDRDHESFKRLWQAQAEAREELSEALPFFVSAGYEEEATELRRLAKANPPWLG